MTKKRNRQQRRSHSTPPAPAPAARRTAKSAPSADRRRLVMLSVLIAVMAIVPYVNAIPNGFVLDDTAIIVENPTIRDLGNVGRIIRTDYWSSTGRAPSATDPGLYRPLTLFTYALDFRFWQLDAKGYHVVNVLLHAITTVVVFLVSIDVLGSIIAAAIAAAIFAVHPIHTEAVTSIVGRAEILATLFFLLAFHRARLPAVATSPPVVSNRTWAGIAIASAFYLLGLLSKETAITLPGILAVDDLLRRNELRGDNGADGRRFIVARYVALGLVAALYLTLRHQAVTRQSMIWAGFLGVSPMQRVLTATRVLAEYLGLFLFPRTLLPDYWKSEVPVPTSVLDKGVLLALLVWIALAILVVWKLRRHRSLVLAVAWFFVTILPASNILFPTGIAKAERVLYLPSVGLCLVVGWIYTLVEGRVARRRFLPLAAVPILLALAARTVVRNRDWKDNFTLVSAGLLISPQSPLMNAIAAEELVKRGEAVRAVPLLHEALRQAPTMPGLHTHLGAAYAALGNNSAAVGEYRIALQVNPNDADALNNLGIAHLDTQQNDSAIVILESFLRLRPNDARAENNLGVAYFRRGDLAQAMQHYRRALQLQPDYSRAQVNLNRAMWQQQNAAVKK